ncbi:MAG: cell division protein FtsZ, partial [Saprospiraceae bacterium]|nr:cell division protein FtsZ [Saprospiraceae bacterium]
AEGESRAREAIDKALNSPLLEDNDIRGAKHILLNISSGTKEVTMDEICEITEYIQDEAGSDTDLIWGNCYDESLADRICVTVIATGFDAKSPKVEVQESVKEKIIVSLEDDRSGLEKGVYDKGYREGDHMHTFELPLHETHDRYAKSGNHGDPYVRNSLSDEQPKEDKASKAVDRQRREDLRNQNKRLNNPQAVIDLESEPAYVRRRVELDDVPHSSEINVSRWTISGEDEPEIKKDNPYLHDNVD